MEKEHTGIAEKKKLLGHSVEESRVKRVEKQQSRYRDRGGIFVPAEANPLLDVLLARGVNGESPLKSDACRRQTHKRESSKSPIKSRKVKYDLGTSHERNPKGRTRERGAGKAMESDTSTKKAKKTKGAQGAQETNHQPVAGSSNAHGYGETTKKAKQKVVKKTATLDSDDDDHPLTKSRKSAKAGSDAPSKKPIRDECAGQGNIPDIADKFPPSARKRRRAAAQDSHRNLNTCPTRSEEKEASREVNPRAKLKKGQSKGDANVPGHATRATKSRAPVIPGDDERQEDKQDAPPRTDDQREIIRQKSQAHISKRGQTEAADSGKKRDKVAPKDTATKKPVGKPEGTAIDEYESKVIQRGTVESKSSGDNLFIHSQYETEASILAPREDYHLSMPSHPHTEGPSVDRCDLPRQVSRDVGQHNADVATREQTTKRKRPLLYVPSDSESEDNRPLQKSKSSKQLATDRDGTEDLRPSKWLRGQDELAISNERSVGETLASKSDVQRSEQRAARSTRKTVESAMPTLAIRGGEEDHGTSSPPDEAANKLKGKGRTNGSRSKTKEVPSNRKPETVERSNDGLDNKPRMTSRKRTQPTVEPEGEENRPVVEGGETAKRNAKRRRKVASETGTNEPVAQASEVRHGAGKSSSSHRKGPTDPENKNRSLKENRKARVATTTKGVRTATRSRKPMPRLSAFPDPRVALDSEDEIDFLK